MYRALVKEVGVVHMPCIGHVVSDRPLPAGGLAETQLLAGSGQSAFFSRRRGPSSIPVRVASP